MVSLAITAIGTGTISVLLLVERYKSGSSQIQKDVAEAFETRATQLQQQLRESEARAAERENRMKLDYDAKLSQHTKEIGRLSGVIEEKDKQNTWMEKILQDKNPEVLTILTELKDLMKKIIEGNAQYQKTNTEKLDEQTDILKAGQNRDNKVDKANA